MGKEQHNIVITGFMGTGKTSVGCEVARLLGWQFVDMDAVIESRAGKTIAEIFAQDGEATFRQMEAALCRELAEKPRIVIATGGGALVPEANRTALLTQGMGVCLSCTLDTLWERLEAATDRPMLDTPDRRARIAALLAQRTPAYQQIPHQIDTTARSIPQVARQVVALWTDTQAATTGLTLPVRTPDGGYPIYLGRKLLSRAGELLADAGLRAPRQIGLVSNPIVGALYAAPVENALGRGGYTVTRCLVPDGESHKTLDTVRTMYDAFADARLDRASAIVALGGGVIGDMAGFAAATYLRGVPFVQMPTTLLAMVDSSVGGKVAVDHPRGKNLIGAFKQPALVIADLDVLQTLPPAEYRAGLAEVIKAGIIAAPELFAYLEEGGAGDSAWPIAEAIRVKVEVVQEDPYERGRRAVLNLGHTFAHAFELLSDYQMRHGEAVSVGLVAAARLAEAVGLAEEPLAARLMRCLAAHGLPTSPPPLDPDAVWDAMGSDKKRQGGRIRFILPRRIGDVVISDAVRREDVRRALRALCGQGEM